MNYEEIKEDIKNILSEKRYIHSLGVAKRAEELGKIYGVETEKLKIVGIAHDIAKEMKKEEAYKYAEENNIKLDEIEKREPSLLHSKIGAYICKNKYGFTDDMCQAILYHTTGNVDMNTFDKIIFLADKTEENRTYIDIKEAVETSNKDINEGVLYVCGVAIKYNIKHKKLIHPDTIYLINKIIMEKM